MKAYSLTSARLLALYDQVSDAPDAAPRLRRFVLDLAVRGKLVEQDAGDEPASQLLKRIAAEKARLVKAGEIKLPKPFAAVAADEEPYTPPPGWTWARLADIAVCLDYMRKPINSTERDKRIEGKAEDELFPYYGATQQQGWIDDYIFDEELVLLGEDGVPFFDAYRSKAYIINGKTWVNNHAHVFKGILISHPFLAHYLNVFDYTGRVVGATRSKLNQARAVDIPVPLPPLSEQKRIVARVDELMGLLDQLEAARHQREAARDRLTAASFARLTAAGAVPAEPEKWAAGAPSGSAANETWDFPAHARFALDALPALTTRPGQIKTLRQTILNLAVRGKLVEQDPTEEPASELLTGIARKKAKHGKGRDWSKGKAPSDGLAFEAPVGWAWTTIDQTAMRVTVGHVGPMKDKYVEDGVPFLRSQNVRANAFRSDGLTFVAPEFHQKIIKSALAPGDVVVVRSGNVGTACVIPSELSVANCSDLVVIQSPEAVVPEYLCFYLNSLASVHVEAGSVGVALTHFNTKSVATMPLPLPPLAEQHRIVAKVDALMALCDRLEAALTTADTTRARLLEALLHEALEGANKPAMEAAE